MLKRTTYDQLCNDFGTSRPSFLQVSEENQKFFYVKKINVIQYVWHANATLFKVFSRTVGRARTAAGEAGEQKRDLIGLSRNHFERILEDGLSEFNKAYSAFDDSIVAKVIFWSLFLLAMPIIIFIVFVKAIKIKEPIDKFYRIGGFFHSVPWSEDVVYVTASSVGLYSNLSPEEIVTHEHIHLLQYRNSGRFSGCDFIEFVQGEGLKFWDGYDDQCQESLQYLYQLDEFEARVHELIISNFRCFNSVPKNRLDVIRMFLRCEDFASVVGVLVDRGPAELRALADDQRFSMRSPGFGKQLLDTCVALDDDDMNIRVLWEVLPVMIARLLWYYGAYEESASLGRDIPFPNLFDRIYQRQVDLG